MWKWKNEVKKKKVTDEELKKDYIEIGIIEGWDFSGNYIHQSGEKIVGKTKTERIIRKENGYERIGLYDKNGTQHKLSVHKIINQTLKGGRYEDEIDHKDKVRNNNGIDNLEVVSHNENMIRAHGKAVKQINMKTGETIEIFRCVSDACRKLGKGHVTNISNVCNQKHKTAYGYGWEWCEKKQVEKGKINNGSDISRREFMTRTRGKKVRQINIETGKVIGEFRSINEACRTIGKEGSGNISKVCRGIKKTAYGYRWEWK
jgi:HNH endonuclease/NUMOD1 domain